MACSTGKKQFSSQELAEEALIQLHAVNDFSGQKGPVNVYLCDICGYYHLTSKGDVNPRLLDEQKKGRLRIQQQAARWEEKLRNKR